MPSQIARLAAYIGHARARHLLAFCGLLLGLTLAAATAWFVTTLRQEAIADTARELNNTAFILAADTDRGFQAAEVVQLNVIEHMRELGIDAPEEFTRRMATENAYQLLREHATSLANIDGLALVDVSGRIINVS